MRALSLRQPTDAEWRVINKLARSRTAPAVQVRRARLLKHMAQGASARGAGTLVGGVTGETARHLLRRFNQEGLKALEDRPRPGRKPVLTEEERGRLVMLAKTPPWQGPSEAKDTCHWTVDALLSAAHKEGITVGRTRLWEILQEEGIRWWRRSRSWLESTDSEYPEKRGTLFSSIPPRQQRAR
jgi:transposase